MNSEKHQNRTKIHRALRNKPKFECIRLFRILIASLCYSIDVANATIIRLYADSEENQTDEDREYCEECRDDFTEGATSHPIS